MLELKKGIDILAEIGGIHTLDEAQALFEAKCDQENVAKLSKITNEEALLKIANAISMTDPDAVFVNTGSDADFRKIREMTKNATISNVISQVGEILNLAIYLLVNTSSGYLLAYPIPAEILANTLGLSVACLQVHVNTNDSKQMPIFVSILKKTTITFKWSANTKSLKYATLFLGSMLMF